LKVFDLIFLIATFEGGVKVRYHLSFFKKGVISFRYMIVF